MNKRILMSASMLVFAAAVVAGGTGAFFSDEITSENNVFTAGSVTLGISNMFHNYTGDGEEPDVPDYNDDGFSFSLSDLKPLDEGEVTYALQNGANDAHVCAMVEETDNSENGRVNPEMELGDTGPDGELGDYLSFNFNGNTGLLADISGVWQDLGDFDANEMQQTTIEYCFGEYTDDGCVLDDEAEYNLAQTDSLTSDVSFHAVQTRNNENFTCDDLNGTSTDGTIGCSEEADVMLVLDSSGSVDSGEIDTLQDRATQFVNLLEPSDGGVEVGVVDFDDSASVAQSLTGVEGDITSAINGISSGGNTNLDAGITFAQNELDSNGRAGVPKFMVVITDGEPTRSYTNGSPTSSGDHEDDAAEAATVAKDAGTEIFAIGVGITSTNAQFLQDDIVSDVSSEHYFNVDNFDEIDATFTELLTCEPTV